MADLQTPAIPSWVSGIHRLEVGERATGGENGVANIQAKQLAQRTEFLKLFADEVIQARESEPTLLARIEKRGVEPQNILAAYSYLADIPKAASTENIDVTEGGTMTIDGVELAIGDIALLKDQTDKKQNGLWEVQSGTWNRAAGYTAAIADKDCFTYKFITVRSGTVNSGKIFFLDKDSYEIGTDELEFKDSAFSTKPRPGKIVLRDSAGEFDDIKILLPGFSAPYHPGKGRNILNVLGVSTIAEAGAELKHRCNNDGQIDDSGIPDWTGLRAGDYIDGLDLSSILAERGGTAGEAWNDDYKNNRIVIAGFNLYKHSGDTENAKNHIVFAFANIPLKSRVNSTNDNAGGYVASELRAFLEGTAGNGTGDKSGVTTAAFLNALKAQLGDDIFYTIRKTHSAKGGPGWASYTLFVSTELEMFGEQVYGDEANYWNTNVQFPIYRDSELYRVKRYHGARDWHWLHTPSAGSAANFCNVNSNGNANNNSASAAGGVAPVFCVA